MSLTQRWRTQALAELLAPVVQPVWLAAPRVEVVERTDSTNTRLMERARHDGLATLHLLVAEQQDAGRGRMGRAWHAVPGASLTFSMAAPVVGALRPSMALAVGVAIAQALDPMGHDHAHGSTRLQLKWPNDLWLSDATLQAGGRKLGGILVEATSMPNGERAVVVGVGLNLDRPTLPAGAGYDPAGLREWLPEATAADVLACVVPALARTLASNADTAGLDSWHHAWPRRDLLLGRRVVSVQGDRQVSGVADGVDDSGALRLRLDNGTVIHVHSGEVSVRIVS